MSIYDKLFDWQKKIVDKFSDKRSFGLYLDMGLGKTPISLAFAEKNNCTKILIITINSKAIETIDVMWSWPFWSNALSNTPKIITKKFYKKQKDQDFLKFIKSKENPLVYITNYEALFSRSKNKKQGVILSDDIKQFIKLCSNQNVAIIIDESHKMKDLQSTQTKCIMKIKKELQLVKANIYCYLLSGTPFTTGYIDLYSQLKFMGLDYNKSEFVDNFCVKGNLPGLLGWQQPIIGYKNINGLYDLVHKYALTIKSEEVVELPEKLIVNHVLPESLEMKLYTYKRASNKYIKYYAEQSKKFTEEELEALKITYKNDNVSSANPFYRNIAYPLTKWIADTTGTLWLRARELSIGFQGNSQESEWFNRDRLNKLEDFLRENPDNYLIFYNYTPELFEIFDICMNLGYNIDVYSGEIKSMDNYNKYSSQTEEERFNNKKNVIIANFASGSTGMNWQNYNKCIIFSIPLYKDWEQGIKRVHRLGQKNTVIYHIFYSDNWLDKDMKKSLEEGIDYNIKMFESDFNKQAILKDLEK